MALDPTIPLQVKNVELPNWMDYAKLSMAQRKTDQDISSSQTAQQAQQASIPGIVADSAVKKRVVDFQNWQTDNAHKFIKTDGTVDSNKFIDDAAKAGYFKEAQGLATTDLSNKSQQIANDTNQQSREIAIMKFNDDAIGHMATLLDALPENKRDAAAQFYASQMDKMQPGSGTRALGVLSRPDSDHTNAPVVDKELIKAYRTATMTPLEQGNLALGQGNLSLSQQIAEPGYKERVSTIPDAGTRVDNLQKAVGLDTIVNGNNAAIDTSKQISSLASKPGAMLADKWNSYVAQGGPYQAYQQNIDAYNQRNGTKLSITDGVSAINAAFARESALAAGRASTYRNTAIGGNIKQAAEASPGAAQPTPAQQPVKASGLPAPKSKAEYDRLPKGTKYLTPDGKQKIKQ